jgi:hypothetical protein
MCEEALVSHEHLTSETNNEPRKKCCEQCAFLPSDPQKVQGTEEWDEAVEEMRTGWLAFYCVHSTESRVAIKSALDIGRSTAAMSRFHFFNNCADDAIGGNPRRQVAC